MKINIVKPFLPNFEEISEDLSNILDTGMVTNNSFHVRTFEEELQLFFSSEYRPTLYCNGEMGLYHLIQAWKHILGYSPHETFEVLVPSFTFSGTINAIIQNNLLPVFCDVDDTLVLDLDKLIVDTEKVKMIIVVGAYGNLPNLEKLKEISITHNLVVILDNAPAFGSQYKNHYPNKFGFCEMISLHATKIFSSMEGGLNIVNDPRVQDYLIRLRDYGQYEKLRGNIDIPGLNSKMQEISALVGRKNLEKVDYILNSRNANVQRYQEIFIPLESLGHIKTMRVLDDVKCTYLYYPIILNEDATEFVSFLEENNIFARRYYTANHMLDYYRGKYREQDLSFTQYIKDRIVSLPIHTEMSTEEINYIGEIVNSYFKQK
jgi:dTDP-4-amino-4,6-dideoxygalactose transaminase